MARWEFGRHQPDQQPTWVDYTGGDTVTDIEVTGPTVYAGGHFRWLNNPYGRNFDGAGAVRRMGIAALDPRNGLPLGWNPGRARGWGVWGFASTDQGLWVGHDTDTIGGETHQRLALMPLVRAPARRAPDDTGSLPGQVFLLGEPHDSGYDDNVAERSFDGSSAGPLTDVSNGGVPWSQAQAAFMVDGELYTAFADGTLVRRGYNGVKFGTPRTVEINELTSFSDELATMRAMWFDRASGRLYFTLDGGGNRLFYRYFTPESNVVGGLRFEVPVGTFRADRLSGGFPDGGRAVVPQPEGAAPHRGLARRTGAGHHHGGLGPGRGRRDLGLPHTVPVCRLIPGPGTRTSTGSSSGSGSAGPGSPRSSSPPAASPAPTWWPRSTSCCRTSGARASWCPWARRPRCVRRSRPISPRSRHGRVSTGA